MHTESMPLSGIFSCVRLWIFLGTKKHRNGDKFMKKQTIKTIVTALTAAAMVCSLTGCAGNSSGATETFNAESRLRRRIQKQLPGWSRIMKKILLSL